MRQQKHIRYLIFVFVVASGFFPWPSLAQAIKGAYTTTTEVSLRSGPGMNYPVVTTLPKGIRINVVGREGYWLRVESKHGGAPGYIDEQFAEPETAAQEPLPIAPAQPVAGAYRTLVDVDLRQGPGTNYPLVVKLPSGIRINVVRAEGDWLRVESKRGGKPGYVEKRFVERWTERY
jgi:N-acetylmuramoyl-L-alanine amidase